jgi:hypothetical protein
MFNLDWEVVKGFLRHVLTTAGGSVVAGGYVTDSDWQLGVGAVLTLAGLVWSFVKNRQAKLV